MKTLDNVIDEMMTSNEAQRLDLADSLCESHKDFYGCKGRHLLNYSVAELVSWMLAHFDWDMPNQRWEFKPGMVDE